MTGNRAVVVNIDPRKLRAIVEVGARRASAFLTLSLQNLDSVPVQDFEITSGMSYRFWPDNLTDDIIASAKDEYRKWITSACFRDLEQHYSRFLDEVGTIAEIALVHGRTVQAGTAFGTQYRNNPNIAAKQQMLSDSLGSESHFAELNSISLARNCLAHNLGIVRPRDCNNPERTELCVQWLAFDFLAERGGAQITIDQLPFDTSELPGEGESQLSIILRQKQVTFTVNQRIVLTEAQISQICFFYTIVAGKVLAGLIALLTRLGIIPTNPATDPPT